MINVCLYKIFTEISARFRNLGGQNPAENIAEISRNLGGQNPAEISRNLGGQTPAENLAEIPKSRRPKSCRESKSCGESSRKDAIVF